MAAAPVQPVQYVAGNVAGVAGTQQPQVVYTQPQVVVQQQPQVVYQQAPAPVIMQQPVVYQSQPAQVVQNRTVVVKKNNDEDAALGCLAGMCACCALQSLLR